MNEYLEKAAVLISIAVEHNKGSVSVHHDKIHSTAEMAEADYRFVERYVKLLLWSIGGLRVSVCGGSQSAAGRMKYANNQ